MPALDITDYVDWDWLPGAADEIKVYLTRLLTEGSIVAHAVDSRSKSIASFQEKCARKGYDNPRLEVTDTVAVRLIMYSVTDKDRAVELVRERFDVAEDFNPGDLKDSERRGYDCAHLIVTGEKGTGSRDWMVAGGSLSKYFDRFGGLEIQIRTVASHAWAEFEHSRRYKGTLYEKISEHDRRTIDQLFGAAADARSALDETFTAIERVLANPTRPLASYDEEDEGEEDSVALSTATDEDAGAGTVDDDSASRAVPVDVPSLREFLARRFPDDGRGSDKGVEFACELVEACGIRTIQSLGFELGAIDGAEVRELMSTTIDVTRVRRLDDELLAVFGEDYINWTASIGSVGRREDQLRWRFDRLRDKVTLRRRTVTYQLFGADCPSDVVAVKMPAARVVRELAKIIADRRGPESVVLDGDVSVDDDLTPSTRALPVRLDDGSQIWVATNLKRSASERLMRTMVDTSEGLDLRVVRNGELFLP